MTLIFTMQLHYVLVNTWSCEMPSLVHVYMVHMGSVISSYTYPLKYSCSSLKSEPKLCLRHIGRPVYVTNQYLSQQVSGPCSAFYSKMDIHLESEPLMLRFLRTFRDLLRFVLFTYTVLFGALILAGWTTYFIVAK